MNEHVVQLLRLAEEQTADYTALLAAAADRSGLSSQARARIKEYAASTAVFKENLSSLRDAQGRFSSVDTIEEAERLYYQTDKVRSALP
ncbi:MAG TPA: hypothetical protein ENN69_05660 [Spirochaetia bacterium]|nr:hypothetical protein [Spirochaetia bacterium]